MNEYESCVCVVHCTLQIVFYALQNRENDCQGVKDPGHSENSNCESKKGN